MNRIRIRLTVVALAALMLFAWGTAYAAGGASITFGVDGTKSKIADASGGSGLGFGSSSLVFFEFPIWGGAGAHAVSPRRNAGGSYSVTHTIAWDNGRNIGETFDIYTGSDVYPSFMNAGWTPVGTNYPEGVVHVTWSKFDSTGLYRIYYSRNAALDSEIYAGWSAPVDVSGAYAGAGNSVAADTTVDGAGYVYIAFTIYDGIYFGIYVAVSTDGGASWGTPTRVATDGSAPSIAVDNAGNVHLAYMVDNTQTYYQTSSRGAQNWSQPEMVNGAYWGGFSVIAASNSGSPFIAWVEAYTNNVICAYRSGGSWVRSVVDTGAGLLPSIAVSPNGDVNVAYSKNGYVTFSRSKNDGGAWTTPVSIYPGYSPRLTVGADNKAQIMFWDRSPYDDNGIAAFTKEQ